MEKFWSEALKATGVVAVIGVIVWFVVQQFFSAEIISIFTSQQRFLITLVIIGALLAMLYTAIKLHYAPKSPPASPKVTEQRTANINKSKVHGDFIMGDKSGEND